MRASLRPILARVPRPAALLLLLDLALAASMATAQDTASIGGFVTDAATGETLLLANVIVQQTGRGEASNLSGYYTITGLVPGTYTIRCSYIGLRHGGAADFRFTRGTPPA